MTMHYLTPNTAEADRELTAITAAGERILASKALRQDFLKSLGFAVGQKRPASKTKSAKQKEA